MIEGEDYEVVDECVEEDDTLSTAQNKCAEVALDVVKTGTMESKAEDGTELVQDIKQETNIDSVTSLETTKLDYECVNDTIKDIETSVEEKKDDPIDFTADINLDQLDKQKDITDEDVLNNLDDIENIVLTSSGFTMDTETDQSMQGNSKLDICDKSETLEDEKTNEIHSIKQEELSSDKEIKTEASTNVPGENDWYEKKLAEKETIIKERLSKVARVLGISYPSYEKWLEWEEKINGSHVCKLKPSRRCRLDKPYTNRWKFVCSRKSVQESTKKMGDADTSLNKSIETVWRLEATGAWGVNTNNESEFPPFVLRAVKIFEEFLQTTEQADENFSDDISMDIDTKNLSMSEGKQQWSWLLVRCNSMDELMLFATGKNISRSTMDRLKQVYETGPGKDCNVKSLYCKSVNKCGDSVVTNTTFLVGSEALDEIVGGMKVQLAPKTNFWSNAAGAENVANTVMDFLAPTPNTTVLEIGCGIGLIGLMMASKCQQVIGVDSPSEVEEAELTCELNNIKNATFIMGSPSEVTSKITAAVKNRKTCAVINANTNIGRAIEVMTCLRKIQSLKRIVMVTTLTKQSVRAILELARPVDRSHGCPFIPVLACVVDILPIGPHFEAVILLQRRMVTKFSQPWYHKGVSNEAGGASNKNAQEKKDEQGSSAADKGAITNVIQPQGKKNSDKPVAKFVPARKGKVTAAKKQFPAKKYENIAAKNKLKMKRPYPAGKSETPPNKMVKKSDKVIKPWHTDPTKKKKDWLPQSPHLRMNPLYEKKLRENKEQADLRERLSSNRVDTDIAQKVKEHQVLLEIAKEKLSGPATTVDANTAKQLQNMLNMVLEQTNKLQSQLPRSVWDRIAPAENANHAEQRDLKQVDPFLKTRYVQEMGTQELLITAPNRQFQLMEQSGQKPQLMKKYHNLPPLEPNLIMPVGRTVGNKESPFQKAPERHQEVDMRKQQIQGNSWNRDKMFEKNRWNEPGGMRKPGSPMRRPNSPIRPSRPSPSRRFSPKRPLLSPPRRPCSPPRRHFSPFQRPASPFRERSPLRRQMSPQRRPMSPIRIIKRLMSPPRHTEMSAMMRPMSPVRQPMSPPRRPGSPMRQTVMSPSRRQLSPIRRQMSPQRRQILSPNRMISPSRQDLVSPRRQMVQQERRPMMAQERQLAMPQERRPVMTQERQPVMPQETRQIMPQSRQHVSPMRRGTSPQGPPFGRPVSPVNRRQLSPPRRQPSPSRRFTDEWDIPSRGAIEQNTWARPPERPTDNVWRSDRPSTSNTNWEQNSGDSRYRKPFAQDKWDIKDPTRGETWNNEGNIWNSKQMSAKPGTKEIWLQGSSSRWTSTATAGPSGDNWNIRGKESLSSREEAWMENKKQSRWENTKESWNQGDKEDWNDLPEDARDPWGDDGNLDSKERWLKYDNAPSSSTWTRDGEQGGDSWSKQKDNWQNKGQPLCTKSQWQNNGNQKVGDARWLSQNDPGKKLSSNTWQSGSNSGSWQSQNYNFQSQRPFSTTQFKDSR